MRELKCPCGRTAMVDMAGKTLGDVQTETGFVPLMTNECRTFYVCPGCADRIAALTRHILHVLGQPEYMAFVSMECMTKKRLPQPPNPLASAIALITEAMYCIEEGPACENLTEVVQQLEHARCIVEVVEQVHG